MPSPTEYAYLAGIIDGEGYVGVGGSNHGIVLCMADVDILYWCHEHFEGRLSERWKSERNARSRRVWAVRAKPALRDLIPRLLPYAVLKGEELALCLAYSELQLQHGIRRNNPAFAKQHAERDRLAEAARAARAARKSRT